MKRSQKYKKIEDDLDKIIISEINDRFTKKQKKQHPITVKEIMEKKNREIVRTHQKSKTASNLPLIFSGYLQVKEGGKLHFAEKDLKKKEFESYLGRKNRLEALLGASLNTLEDEDLINIVYQKKKTFEDEYNKAKEVMGLVEQTLEIKKNADEPDLMIPKDEEMAISYLREIAPLKAGLQKIESRYIEIKEEAFYIGEVLQQLQSAINLAFKSINLQSRKASRFLFDQAKAVFQHHKSSRTGISTIEDFIQQKEGLIRYYSIFDSINDENRKKQTGFFISTIEASIENLQKTVVRQKQRETEVSEKNQQKTEKAYETFLGIKEAYSQGEFDTKSKKKAVPKLRRCQDILKSNGQRIKAREIDRFINATGIDKKEEKTSPDTAQTERMFYKRAFFGILPITIFLAVLNAYHFLSGCKTNESDEITAITEQIGKGEKSVAQQTEAAKEDQESENQ